MKMRDAAEVALSVMGVFKIVTAVLRMPWLAYFSYLYISFYAKAEQANPLQRQPLAYNFGEFAANLIVGILLVLMARRIADWLVRHSVSLATTDVDLRIVSPEGFRFCIKLVGISMLVEGMATLVKWDLGDIVAGALILALGTYLIRGGGWLTRFAWGKAGA
jgi:Ca2+/Na+ antiporter